MNHPQISTLPDIDDKYIGKWTNTWKDSSEIRQFSLFKEDDELWMSIKDPFGGESNTLTEKIKTFASSPTSNKVIAFGVTFDFGNMIADMSINYNKGILIIACFHKYQKGSMEKDYFTRQFYSRVGRSS